MEDTLDVERQHLLERRLVELGQGAPQVAPALLTRMSRRSRPRGHFVGQPAAPRLGGQVGREADARAFGGKLSGDIGTGVSLA